MKKSILKLGKALTKAEQRTISGGKLECCGIPSQPYNCSSSQCITYSPYCAQVQCRILPDS